MQPFCSPAVWQIDLAEGGLFKALFFDWLPLLSRRFEEQAAEVTILGISLVGDVIKSQE